MYLVFENPVDVDGRFSCSCMDQRTRLACLKRVNKRCSILAEPQVEIPLQENRPRGYNDRLLWGSHEKLHMQLNIPAGL